jgi:hypothetical protein
VVWEIERGAGGVYVVRLAVDGQSVTRKITLVQ